MKKIVAVVGSPRPLAHSSTYQATSDFVNAVAEASGQAEAELIYLNQQSITDCTGCLSCQQTGKCFLDDDMEPLIARMRQADLLVFGSPVHFGFVSSTFQTFVERSLMYLHTFELLGKAFVTVVTTNGSGEQEADKYLTKIGHLFGCVKIGSVLKSENDSFSAKRYSCTVKNAASVLAGGKVRPKLVNKLYFSSMKQVILKNPTYFKAETELWQQKDWFGRRYNEIFYTQQLAYQQNQSCLQDHKPSSPQ